MLKAMENVRVVNGLEYKIQTSTFKVVCQEFATLCRDSPVLCSYDLVCNGQVSYVLDTEDLFHRRKRQCVHRLQGSQTQALSSRVGRFHKWLDVHERYSFLCLLLW